MGDQNMNLFSRRSVKIELFSTCAGRAPSKYFAGMIGVELYMVKYKVRDRTATDQ